MIYDCGFEGLELFEFISGLRHAGVKRVFDLRLKSTEKKRPGYDKTVLLPALEAADIVYEAVASVDDDAPLPSHSCPSAGIIQSLSQDTIDHVVLRARLETIALMCYEKHSGTCERVAVLDKVRERDSGIGAQHLALQGRPQNDR